MLDWCSFFVVSAICWLGVQTYGREVRKFKLVRFIRVWAGIHYIGRPLIEHMFENTRMENMRLLLYDAVFEYFSTGRQLIRLYSKNYLNSDIVFHFDETFSNPKNSRFFIPLDSNLRPSCSGEHQIAWSLPSRQRALPNGLLHIRVSFAKLSRPIFHPFTNPTGLTHSDGHAIIQFIPGCFYNICQHDCTMETNNVRWMFTLPKYREFRFS